MLTDVVKPGDKIEIQGVERAILGAGSGRKVYASRVYDILDDEKMEILMPLDGTKLLLLPVDGEYQFCFYSKKGLYQCFVRIVERYKSNNVYLLLCEMTSPLGKFQRREYYRYACTLPLRSRDMLEEEEKSIEDGKFRMQIGLPFSKGRLVDISGGGVRFVTGVRYDAGQQIILGFNLNVHGKETPYDLVGEVLNCKENELHRGEYEHRLKFTVIDHEQREEIIKYIFEEERKSRKRLQN